MPNTKTGNGACLCGAVQFTVASLSTQVGACHCNMCRKWTGGPLMAIECGTDIIFSGEENIKVYNSSDWAERGFCMQCGSHLFYRLKENNLHIMPAGLFDDYQGFVFDHQVFIDEKPDYYEFSNKTKNMTGEQVFAQFSTTSKN